MAPEPNKKNPRTFQCRDGLWMQFEQMARELECSVDYLINDAMKQYARQRGYTSIASSSSMAPPSAPTAAPTAVPPPRVAPPPPPLTAPPRTAPPPLPGASGSGLGPLPGAAAPPPPPPAASRAPLPPPPGRAPPPMPGPSRRPAPPPGPPMGGRLAPPPMPGSAPPTAPPARATRGGLSIQYQGEVFRINKDRFIIGRGKQSSDLTIKDPNVSRQHAMIEFLNGQYYIVDMGSTNGVEYNGQRVQRKAIHEGDTFRVCDHELRFSYQ